MSASDATVLEAEYRRALEETTSDAYRSAPAERQCEILWQAVSRTPYSKLPPAEFSMLSHYIGLLNRAWLRLAFDDNEVRPPRTKLFHPFGTVAKVRFDAKAGHPYTGLFRTGTVGLARLSLALNAKNYAPSAAFKLFVDGQSSRNLLLDQSLDRQTSRDFFERAPTNITLWPSVQPLRLLWYIVNWWLSPIAPVLHQYLDHLAGVTREGATVANPRVPHRLFFEAPGEVHGDPSSGADFRDELAGIPTGTLLYEVFASSSAQDPARLHLASVTTESPFVASAFGDRVLALSHVRPPAGVSVSRGDSRMGG